MSVDWTKSTTEDLVRLAARHKPLKFVAVAPVVVDGRRTMARAMGEISVPVGYLLPLRPEPKWTFAED